MKLTEFEAEFVAEMAVEPWDDNRWTHFDPPFPRYAYEKFVRKGWLEYEGDGASRQFRLTEEGRSALRKEEDR